jgi:hypothetical protein
LRVAFRLETLEAPDNLAPDNLALPDSEVLVAIQVRRVESVNFQEDEKLANQI